MKSPSLLAFAAAVLTATAFLHPLAAEEDGFTPIEAQLSDRAVVMKLPEGVRRVRLRVKGEDQAWNTVTIAHLEGNEGFLKLRLPDGVAMDDCEISISRHDPFPYSAYHGQTDHPGTDSNGSLSAVGPEAQFSNDGDAADRNGEEVTVEESDIWKWRDRTLYFFNQYRGLQAIDVSDPAAPKRLATHPVESYGEKMYLHPDADMVILLTYDASEGKGRVDLVAHEATHTLQQRQSFPVPGYILESRLIGKVLYVVSRSSWRESISDDSGTIHLSWRSGLSVSKIDLSDPDNPVASPDLMLSDDRWNYWGAQVQATPQALLVSTNAYDSSLRQTVSTLHVVDVSDPDQSPKVTHHLPIAGHVLNKFNMNLKGDTLTVVSQVWRGRETRRRYASVETFDLGSPSPRLDHVEFANNESITATRFVGDLLYVVTFLRIDPLFVIDLSQPSNLRILSELEIPGFSTYLAPHGDDALISIGVEDSQIAVSWFDVSDPTDTSLASRVYIGAEDGWAWTEANWDEKALGFYPADGLILVPYQGSVPGKGWTSGVQLVEIGDRELTKRGSFEHEFQARRARVLGDAVVSISGRALRTLDISDRDHPKLLSELILAWPVDIVHRIDNYLVQFERGSAWHGREGHPKLYVSPVEDPDSILDFLDLSGQRVTGTFLHEDCLFVAQSGLREEGEVRTGTFITTVIDVSDPTRPEIIGHAEMPEEATDTNMLRFGGDLQGALLPGGALVWYPAEQSHPFFGLFIDVADVDGLFPFRGGWGANQVYTVDVSSKEAPRILASKELPSGRDTWPEGEIVLAGSTLYCGMQKAERVTQADGTSKWINRHWLGHVDLSDPASPVPGELVSLPGTFEHALDTPSGGTLLFTSAYRNYRTAEGYWTSDLEIQSLAFDETRAYLLEETVIEDWRYGAKLFDERSLILASNDYSNDQRHVSLSVHTWDFLGQLQERHQQTHPGTVHDLGVEQDLLIMLGSELTFVDFADRSHPDPARISFSLSRFWQRPNVIEIHERAHAYLPLGWYGISSLDFAETFAPVAPAPAPAPGESPMDAWQKVALHSLPITCASNALMGEALLQLDWSFCAPHGQPCLDYASWTRLAFGLGNDEPFPSFETDSDLDGRPNGWEYFTGTDPTDATHFSDLEIEVVTDQEGVRFLTGRLQVNPSAPILSQLTPKFSLDLAVWIDDPRFFEATGADDPLWPGLKWKLTTPVESQHAAFLKVEAAAE